ncbi:MAG TPA: Hpt domain-containing protein [Myxococcota bacterium]|nr:Hpt domain-containing protein [Myxococcota bacterium]
MGFLGQFVPHGRCYAWTPSILWASIASDVTIAISYFSIPVALETRENLERLPATIASGAWTEVRRQAHSTKSAMRMFGAREAQHLAENLEQLAQMDDRNAAADLYLRMKSAVEPVVAVLARFSETGQMDSGAPT